MVFEHALNPIIFNLGPLEIRWYGLMYVLAFLVTYYYVRGRIRSGQSEFTEKDLDDFTTLQVIALIVGARIFYAIFYEPSHFIQNPLRIFAIWQGGLSFHGGLTAMLVCGWWYCRKKKYSILKTADLFIVPLALGQSFGRIGNFINGELWGYPTSLPWGVKFQNVEEYRHPSQLYESAYNLVIFSTLYLLRNKKLPDGTLFSIFLIMYGIFRFIVEFVREPEIFVGPLTMGQTLTIPVFLAGICLLWHVKSR